MMCKVKKNALQSDLAIHIPFHGMVKLRDNVAQVFELGHDQIIPQDPHDQWMVARQDLFELIKGLQKEKESSFFTRAENQGLGSFWNYQ